MKTSVHDFDEQICGLFNPIQVFRHIHHVTNGDPCTTGCAWYQGGKCPGYRKVAEISSVKSGKLNFITNAEIAKELHCSTRKVSKLRKAGELPEKYMKVAE